jgi:hypothetical protein
MDEFLDNDIIRKFKEFQRRSNKRWKAMKDGIKEDKKYLKDPSDKYDVETLGKDRASKQLNVIRNAVRTICNSYRERPYRWSVKDLMTDSHSDMLTKAGDTFIDSPDNQTAAIQVLNDAVSFGLGVFVISNELGIDGSPEPCMYCPKIENVYLDPDCTKLNGADQTEAAIVELKSRKWVRDTYGLDISSIDSPNVDIEEEYDRREYMPLVTYYVRGKGQVNVYKMLGNSVSEEITLPMTYIPIIPVFGEKVSDEADERDYIGIVDQMEGIQRLINYGYSNILIRLASNPKNTWMGGAEAIENYERYYKDSNKTLNPLLMFNEWSADGKRELQPPQRISNEIPIGDVGELFTQSLQMVNNIIGIPAIGMESETEKTATEVLTAAKTFQNNIRTYIWNMRSSLSVAGMCLFELISGTTLYGQVKIEVVQGPDELMKKQEARVILQQFAPLLTEPQDQRKLLMAMANVENQNEYVQSLVRILQPMPTMQELQDQELINQANNEIKQRDLQIAQLQKQLEDAQRETELKAYSLDRELALAQLKHQQEMEKLLLQHRLDGELTDKDLMDMSMEAQHNQNELEKEALELDRKKAEVEMETEVQAVKSASEIEVANAKAEQSRAKAREIDAKTRNKEIK